MHYHGSPGMTSDDKLIKDMLAFEGQEVVITEKMDGENSTLYHDFYHAKSIDSKHHPSRDWLKRFHAEIGYNIPVGYRICGENMFAQHSISYDNLESFFYGFSMWSNDPNVCLNWDYTIDMFELIGITPVPLLYRGIYDEAVLLDLVKGLDKTKQEGLVMRVAGSFPMEAFSKKVCKWVRADHVQTDQHWMHAEVKPNRLKT
jgi:hypothetical protein